MYTLSANICLFLFGFYSIVVCCNQGTVENEINLNFLINLSSVQFYGFIFFLGGSKIYNNSMLQGCGVLLFISNRFPAFPPIFLHLQSKHRTLQPDLLRGAQERVQ